eukprot:Pompholyxophrys_punicea_v1_NODE_832_length_1230_cov_14.935374.p1 type:complete len:245 gc:universal NODE_832_length_1230_cov_14.935374:70-804(+)
MPFSKKNIISVIGPLHVSLNTREILIIKFVPMLSLPFYKSIFGEGKKLALKPKPWRMSLILELANGSWSFVRSAVLAAFSDCCDPEYLFLKNLLEELIPASLDVYSTFLRGNDFLGYLHCLLRLETSLIQPMKRKNYKKILLAFIADVAFWKLHPADHPYCKEYDRLSAYIVYHNDWWVEGFHCQIRRRTNPGAYVSIVQMQARCADYDNHRGTDFEEKEFSVYSTKSQSVIPACFFLLDETLC